MLGLNYKNEEELNRDIFSGKIQREIFDYIKEIHLNHEIYPEMYTEEINRENVYDYFDAEVGDDCIGYEKICSPGTNKYATIFHNLIEAVYEEFTIERTLWWEKNNYKEVTINERMDSTELYKLITYVTTFEKIEEGHYLNYIRNYDFDYKDSKIIYDACHSAWLKNDSDISLDRIVSSICEAVKDRKIELEEITMMSRHYLIDAVSENDYECYTRLHYKKVLKSSLDELIKNPQFEVIYELNNSDAKRFIELYETAEKDVPHVRVVSDCIAIDNSEGSFFVEEFDCNEKALKWVESDVASKKNIEDIFDYYDQEIIEEIELGI